MDSETPIKSTIGLASGYGLPGITGTGLFVCTIADSANLAGAAERPLTDLLGDLSLYDVAHLLFAGATFLVLGGLASWVARWLGLWLPIDLSLDRKLWHSVADLEKRAIEEDNRVLHARLEHRNREGSEHDRRVIGVAMLLLAIVFDWLQGDRSLVRRLARHAQDSVVGWTLLAVAVVYLSCAAYYLFIGRTKDEKRLRYLYIPNTVSDISTTRGPPRKEGPQSSPS